MEHSDLRAQRAALVRSIIEIVHTKIDVVGGLGKIGENLDGQDYCCAIKCRDAATCEEIAEIVLRETAAAGWVPTDVSSSGEGIFRNFLIGSAVSVGLDVITSVVRSFWCSVESNKISYDRIFRDPVAQLTADANFC
jgi:hypothetical protein